MSDSGGSVENELDRDIGLIGAISLGMGTMIAAGIFVLSGLAVSNVGAAAIVSFLLAGVVASFTALAYAEFSALYPESGGGYAYVANVFDSDLTYIVGWSIILGYPASAAFYLASFSSWFTRFITPALSLPEAIPYWLSGLVILGLLVGVNLKGTEETGMFQIVVTGLKVTLIALFLAGGLQAFDPTVVQTSLANNITQFGQIGVTTTLVFITFFGFEAIATNAEEIEEPGHNIPRAIFLSMGLVSVIYALVVLVIVFAIQDQTFLLRLADQVGLQGAEAAREYVATHGEVSMAYASQYYLGNIGFWVIIVGALLSMISAANATILAGSRVKLAMSRRGHLPSVFGDLSDRYNTPYASVLFTGGLILLYILVFSVLFGTAPGSEGGSTPLGIHLGFHAIAHFADFMLLAGLIFVNIALIQSRRKEPDLDRSFEVPFVPWIPGIAILANLVLVTQVEQTALYVGLIAEAIGVVFWFGYMRNAREPDESEATETAAVRTARDEISERDREEQLLVPIAQTENVEQLMRTAVDVAENRDAELLVMSAVTVPEQTPLGRADRFIDEERDVVNEAMAFAEDSAVPVHGLVRVGHEPEEIILHTIDQHDSDAVLLGWGGQGRSRQNIALGSTVDEVVREADADVLVERVGDDAGDDVDSILVPTAGGPHAHLAGEVAGAIAASEDATCTFAKVVDPDASEDERETARDQLAEVADSIDRPSVDTKVLEGRDITDRLLEETKTHDVTVVGATRQSRVRQIVFGVIPETLGRKARNITIMTKRRAGKTNRLTGQIRQWVGGD
ncbi:amino acid permease [Halomicroarcula limicola]|uniref:Amino acid permease n=1 Tax=Haloarcula limicola TaxID=1429915 RepID=A0A8J7YCT3_9EURY|nr:amino acid permease [Halomicroarcula limicola]MBV0924876.1 amino acid permease [Halomicroarcula limicola]